MIGPFVFRDFLKILGDFALASLFIFAICGIGQAQTILPSSYDPTTGFLTATDAAGNTYLVNLSAFSQSTKNLVPGSFTPQSGTPVPVSFVITPLDGIGDFTISGVAAGQTLLACSASTVLVINDPNFITYPANCYLTDTPRALLSSIKQELRSQSNEVIDMITDRLRGLTQDLAEGSLPAVQTPPGGTVILNDFSSNPQPKYNGLSAGAGVTRWGLWANASGSFLTNNNPAFAFNGPSVVALTGLDYIIDRKWIVGLAAGYTHANLALSPSFINREVDGAVVGPYAAYIFDSNWSIDALANYTSLENDITAPLPFPAGSYHSDRVTAASNLNYFTTYDGFKLTGFGGYAYSWEGGNTNLVLPSALANNVKYGAIRIGGEAAYPVGAWEPYVPLRFEYETTTTLDGTSRAALVVGAGLRYRWSDMLTGGLLFESTELKTHTRDLVISGHLRWSF